MSEFFDAKTIYNMFKKLFEGIRKGLKNLSNSYRKSNNKKRITRNERLGWSVPKSTIKPSQVWNRKPAFSYIRNSL